MRSSTMVKLFLCLSILLVARAENSLRDLTASSSAAFLTGCTTTNYVTASSCYNALKFADWQCCAATVTSGSNSVTTCMPKMNTAASTSTLVGITTTYLCSAVNLKVVAGAFIGFMMLFL